MELGLELAREISAYIIQPKAQMLLTAPSAYVGPEDSIRNTGSHDLFHTQSVSDSCTSSATGKEQGLP